MDTGEKITEESESQDQDNGFESKIKDDCLDAYLLILIPGELKIDFTGINYKTENINNPSIIYKDKIYKKDGTFIEKIVFKFEKKEKSSKLCAVKFFKNENTYNIRFSSKNESFIYNPKFTTGNKYLKIFEDPIEQNLLFYEKLDIFLEALDKNNEKDKENILFKDTINLYAKKKQFSLLVTLFLKIYKKNKKLCKDLIKLFYDINNEENDDRLNDLKKYLEDFKDIYSKRDQILEEYEYNKIHFFGILFCYLYSYDKANFPEIIKEFSIGNSDILYEILIKYNLHFKNHLKQNQEFYNKFIIYILEKKMEFDIFKKALNYIEDIETFLYSINSNKETIFEIYEDNLKKLPIKMTGNLLLKKHTINKTGTLDSDKNKKIGSFDEEWNIVEEDKDCDKDTENECDIIIKHIEKIIKFSKTKNLLAIYMKSTFWINLITNYNNPDLENIVNIHNLRELYKKYNQLIKELYQHDTKLSKKEKERINDIKTDINRYYERDEFAFLLNKNIRDYFEKNKNDLKNSVILGIISRYNPYFSIKDKDDKKKYRNYRETYIFDYVNFNETSPIFIQNFQTFNFEEMFEENITEYINKITGKIINIETFGNIIKLIKIERIKEEKQKDYFRILEETYKLYIKNHVGLIQDNILLKKSIKIIAEFVSMLFLFEKNNRFLKDEISLLDEKIKSLVYIELITTYNSKDYEEQKNFIYDIYLRKIKTKEGRDNIINLVKNLKVNHKVNKKIDDKADNKVEDKVDNKVDDRDYFIYEKLLEKCIFEKEDFFSNQENYKIQTLCLLNKELQNESKKQDTYQEEEYNDGKDKKKEIKLDIKIENRNAQSLQIILDQVREELENGTIKKKDLEKFLNIKKSKKAVEESKEKFIKKIGEYNNDENINKINTNDSIDESSQYVREKLDLISLVLSDYDGAKKFKEYKDILKTINESVVTLEEIKDNLMVFHRNRYNNEIKKIVKILKEIENSPIQKINSEETKKAIGELLNLKKLSDEIQKYKDFLLFKKIFDNAQGKDQAVLFENALLKLNTLKTKFVNKENIETILKDKEFENIFKKIIEELGRKTDNKSKEFIKQMIDKLEIKEKNTVRDLRIIINSKKYENIVKSIKYFFDNFMDKKLDLPENINLSDMDLQTLKINLEILKARDIYEYDSKSCFFYEIFTSFYEKKQAIDFLISKINLNADDFRRKLKDKLDPTNRSISIKDIDDTINCLKEFQNFKNMSAKDILNAIKIMHQDELKIFKSYTKKFLSIIELNEKKEEDRFEKVYDIIEDSSLLFNLDNEDFLYYKDGKPIKIENIDELIKLKNKINIQPQKKVKENEEKKNDSKTSSDQIDERDEKEKIKQKDIFEIKCDKLLFFKNIISNLEIIYEKMNILRKKGFNIPIVINITIKYPNIVYLLNDKKKNFDNIKDYLFSLKTDFEKQLDTIYQNEKYLRLIYGKFFRKAMLHQGGNCDISEILRYILNKTDNQDKIKDGDLNNITLGEDFEDQYHYYSKRIFDSISNYMTSLFINNDLDLNKHYENMKILENNKYKGIFIKKCVKISMEEYILGLFIEKLDKLPIAQNILICSKETSIEEIQSFFNRAILCDNNTLFVVEILESFSNFQHNKMYSYIDTLLSVKLEKFKKENKDNKKKTVDKSKSNEYLDSFIVFVYKYLENEEAFKNELGKYIFKKQKDHEVGDNRSFDKESKDFTNNAIDKENEKDLRDANVSGIPIDNNSIQDNDDLLQNKIIIPTKYEITENIKVISSDVCGLGKSFRIIDMIEKEKKIINITIFL